MATGTGHAGIRGAISEIRNKMKKLQYTLGLVDDQPDELVLIQRYISRLPYLNLMFVEQEPQKALNIMEEECPDILMLDIQMPGMDGFQLFESLEHRPVLVVCSSHGHYGYEASHQEAVGYIPKVLGFGEFEQVMQRAVQQVDRSLPNDKATDSIRVKSAHANGAWMTIPLSEIIHISVKDKEVTFHCADQDRNARTSLRNVEALLPTDQFIRVHKSHIINLNQVDCYTKTNIILFDYKQPIPIGDKYRHVFMEL